MRRTGSLHSETDVQTALPHVVNAEPLLQVAVEFVLACIATLRDVYHLALRSARTVCPP